MSKTRVLIVQGDPTGSRRIIQSNVPHCAIQTCSEAENLAQQVANFRPDCALLYKLPGLTPEKLQSLFESDDLKWAHNSGVGIDHLPRWDTGKLTVTNGSGVLADFMTEYVTAALLMANIGFPKYWRQQQQHHWKVHDWTSVIGKNLLVVGLGNIGRRVAVRGNQLGMNVTGVRTKAEPVPGVDKVFATDQLIKAVPDADFICVHVASTPKTRRLINADIITTMKPSAIFINTARGGVVDQAVLTKALQENKVAGAVLDVTEPEPLPEDDPLWELDNVVITPHMSDSVSDWEERFGHYFCESLRRFIDEQPLENIVDPERGY
jgi:phosphoglycerate dehydrogenase-like enzyme